MSEIPIRVANPTNYSNPCDKHKKGSLGLKTYLVSHVNQYNPELREHTDPLASHFGKVNNAAATNAPDIYYSGLAGGCLQGDNPDVNPMGGNWLNNCQKSVDYTHNYNLDPLFNHAPGTPNKFDDEQKAILLSLNEVIPGFNQLHISNEQFCKYNNNWHYVPQTDNPGDALILGNPVTDGVYNPTECSAGDNDILCQYFKCPSNSEFGKGAKCGSTNNPLYVMKDTQQYKQTLDGQYLDGIGPEKIDQIVKNQEWKNKYDVGHCVNPGPGEKDCKPSDIKGWVASGAGGQGTQTCDLYNELGFCMLESYKTNLDKDITYPNAPVLTTGGTCYYAGIGGRNLVGPGGASTLNVQYDRGMQYHDRYVKNPKYSSTANKWNYTGGSAYGMLEWDPKDDSNQITRALNSVFSPDASLNPTNQSFDLSPYKAKCNFNPQAPSSNKVALLQGQFNQLSLPNALTLTCPIACPYDSFREVCKPRAVCGDLTTEHEELGLKNYETDDRPCPIYCPAGPPASSSGDEIVNYCIPNRELYEPICPPMGTNYSLIGRNLGMIEAPKQNSAFFHNHFIDPTTFKKDLKGEGNLKNFRNVFTSAETIGTGSPGGRGSSGFDAEGYYQMPQGVNPAEEILCEYTIKSDTDPSISPGSKGAQPNFVDMLTDPRQVAWMWEGTADSGIPPKDHATQINTLGLYIRGKKTFNPQKQVNLNPFVGSIEDVDQCSVWQDQMVDLCMNHEVQNPEDCYRPPSGELATSWKIRYPLDIPPEFASPSTNTVCPILMSKPQRDVWENYHGIPQKSETPTVAMHSEYNTGKYCKDWYHTMADTYNAFVDKSADVASEKFNKAAETYCHKIKDGEAVNRFNFECGCINADPGQFHNKHSNVVGAIEQGGPQALSSEQKYCYLGACDVGAVGSMQHDRLLDPRYGNWSYPEAPIIQNPHESPCTKTYFNRQCISPTSQTYTSPSIPCWRIDKTIPPPDALISPAPPIAMCPTPQCDDPDFIKNHQKTKQVDCNGYISSSLQKCPNFSCEELLMVEGSTLENDEINSGISICQRHGTGVGNRWKYNTALGHCIYTEGGDANQDSNTPEQCKAGHCKTLVGNTNDPYFFPTFEACEKASTLEMKNLPRTNAPPPYMKSVFTNNQMKWSCSNKKCIQALGIGEYTNSTSCEKFCGVSSGPEPIILIIIILISIGIFVAIVMFALHKYKKKYHIKSGTGSAKDATETPPVASLALPRPPGSVFGATETV